MEQDLEQGVQAPPDRTLEAIGEAAEMWNAAWEAGSGGGRLHLPVLAGVRRGRVLARVEVEPTTDGSQVRLEIERVEYEVNRPAVLFLVLGAVGGLVTILWPLYPDQMINFLPLAVVLLIGAWLLVASRLRTAGPRDFLDTVAEVAEGDGG